MRLHDINVLVYAHRKDSPSHTSIRDLFAAELSGEQTYGVSDYVLNGFIRIVTNHRIYRMDPTPIRVALAFAEQVRHQPNAVVVAPGVRHWSIFERLCTEIAATATDVPDAYLAALAIEHGCELVTADKGFTRFRGLRVSRV